jgi:hypothetical protein
MSDPAQHFRNLCNKYRATFCDREGSLHPSGQAVIDNLKQMTKYGHSPFSTDPVRWPTWSASRTCSATS